MRYREAETGRLLIYKRTGDGIQDGSRTDPEYPLRVNERESFSHFVRLNISVPSQNLAPFRGWILQARSRREEEAMPPRIVDDE